VANITIEGFDVIGLMDSFLFELCAVVDYEVCRQ